jgi:Zn finger protein HypA/HybF involved in hydrogenase expression
MGMANSSSNASEGKAQRESQRKGKILSEAINYAKSRNGKVLATEINTKKEFVDWECAKGHTWNQPVGALLTNKSWCSICSGNAPRNLQVLIDIATARGGKVLSTEYKNVDATYDFECSLGHNFSNSFKHVEKRGQWCPTCNKGSKSEEICRTTFEQIFGYEFRKVRPKWLRNSRNRQMEIDGFCSELNIGFEYQGIQHFGKQFYGNSLEQRVADDQLKAKLCEDNGISLFILDYRMEYSNFPKEIEKQAISFKLNTTEYDFNKPIDFERAYIRDDRLRKLIELLKPKNIRVLSTKWIGVKDSYQFRCEVCGHEWSATGNHFFNSRRVGGCKKCTMKALAGSNRLNIEEIQEYATQFGGVCLSLNYGEIKQKYKFQCSQGHVFEDIYNNMKFRKTFCPTCEGRNTKQYFSDEAALAIMAKNKLEPKVSRPKFARDGWLSSCLICGEEVSPSLNYLVSGGNPCKYCSGFLIPEKTVREVFAKANLQPVEPFKSASSSWRSKCLICGAIVNGRYRNLVKGQGGCRTCYKKG